MTRLVASILFVLTCLAHAADDRAPTNIAYKSGDELSVYEKERCKLDLYLPAKKEGFTTLVWFHGGGLTNGSKDGEVMKRLGASLAEEGIAVVVPNYRLSPKAKYPAYIDDASAAVAWTLKNISQHGGDATRVFVGGHSAGAYLTLMLGMDESRLAKFDVKHSSLAGLIPVSAQTMTHYTIREERGLGKFSVIADEAAPVRWAEAKGIAPMLVIWADKDMPARAEENAFLVAVLKGAKNKSVTSKVISDRDHSSVGNKIADKGDPARVAILEFMKR
ncbi:alpha/beta hydrolase [Brevifollis gellanilyticus]|uniref:Lipase n=1 Tax=Brevifollis gellanilyticus TaxID=748831 RepID=A0A512M9R4_9BACT|nr:alpha/beta hydrolase [Brevifollis gellanilyticus]GEP43487.1 lipase [Brevifollis gellanilyticus]